MKNIFIKAYGLYLNILGWIAPTKAARTGFLIFCRPFRTRLNQKQMLFLASAEKFQVSVGEDTVQAYRWGTGDKKILFLHGWQSHTYRWKPYIESLDQKAFTIYAVDAPGHGQSAGSFLTVPVYSTVIEKMLQEYGSFHTVVGHSLGGFSLLYTMYRYPLLPVKQIVLLAPPGEAADFISVFQKTLGLSSKTVALVTQYFRSQYDVAPEFFSTSRFAPSLNVNGLIVHDENDMEAPHHYSVALQRHWQRSRLVSTNGFGHNLRSSSVVKEVTDFIVESVTTSQQVSSPLEKS